MAAIVVPLGCLSMPRTVSCLVPLPVGAATRWTVLAHVNPLYYLVAASRVLAAGTFSGAAVWEAFAVLVPLCALVLTWATGVFRRAVA